MKQPLTISRVLFSAGIVRLITAAGQLPSISQIHAKSILLRPGGLNIEESAIVTDDVHRCSITF